MAKAYAKSLPRDRDGGVMVESPAPFLALARSASENVTASSVLTVTDNTTVIEIAPVGAPAVMRWVATTDTQASVVSIAGGTANFDHVIPTATFRRFVIPQETAGTSSVVGANTQNGLYKRYAIKSIGVGSVLTAEY